MNQMNNLAMSVITNGAVGMGSGGPSSQGVLNGGGLNMHRGNAAIAPNEKTMLNTYIYDYFLKNDMLNAARALLEEADITTKPVSQRGSPPQKHDPDGNPVHGMDDSMDTDRKEDIEGRDRRADDLPLPKVPGDCPQGSFLYDWWGLFWDIFGARNGGKPTASASAMTYVSNTQVSYFFGDVFSIMEFEYANISQASQRQRQDAQQRFLSHGQQMAGLNPQQQQALLAANAQLGPQMMNQGYPSQMIRMPNGTMLPEGNPMMQNIKNENLVRQAMNNNLTNQKRQVFPNNA